MRVEVDEVMVMGTIPWWVWTIPIWPTVMSMAYALLVGVLQRRATGRYPSFREWCRAVPALREPAAQPEPEAGADLPAVGFAQQAGCDGDAAVRDIDPSAARQR